jgi:small-conductance mechanosensitive channel
MNIPIYNDKGGEIGRYKDYASSNYDIRIIAGSTLPINRWAMLEEYKQYMQMGVIDDIAFLGETDVPNKEQIMQRKSMIANLTSKVEEMNQAIEDQDHIINNLTKQLIQAGIKEKVNQAEKEIIKSKEELRASDKLFQKRLEDALKLAREDMVRELDKIKDESGARQSEQTIKPSKK